MNIIPGLLGVSLMGDPWNFCMNFTVYFLLLIYILSATKAVWYVHTIRNTGDPIRTRNLSLFGPD